MLPVPVELVDVVIPTTAEAPTLVIWEHEFSGAFSMSCPWGTSSPRGGRTSATAQYTMHCGYRGSMSSVRVSGGVVHELPRDLRAALIEVDGALDAWNDITPLARNEFICWVEDAKQAATRERRIRRTHEELAEGKRRPCCWPGCTHRERNGVA